MDIAGCCVGFFRIIWYTIYMDTKRGTEIGINDSHKYAECPCLDCGKERWVSLRKGKFVSKRCHSCATKSIGYGAKASGWKGGRYKDTNGYIHIKLTPDDFYFPMANKLRYVLEHRLVVARALKRCLLQWEIVHHKEDFAKDDNRYPETLELLPSQYKHNAITHMVNYIHKLKKENDMLKDKLKEMRE